MCGISLDAVIAHNFLGEIDRASAASRDVNKRAGFGGCVIVHRRAPFRPPLANVSFMLWRSCNSIRACRSNSRSPERLAAIRIATSVATAGSVPASWVVIRISSDRICHTAGHTAFNLTVVGRESPAYRLEKRLFPAGNATFWLLIFFWSVGFEPCLIGFRPITRCPVGLLQRDVVLRPVDDVVGNAAFSHRARSSFQEFSR